MAAGYFVQNEPAQMHQASPGPVATGGAFQPLPTRPGRSMLLSTKPQVLPQPTSASLVLRVPSAPPGALAGTALPVVPLTKVALPDDQILTPPSDADIDLDGFGMSCGSDASAASAPGGMIRLTLSAACDPGAVALVEHGELAFKSALGDNGQTVVEVPAFRVDARLRITIGSSAPTELSVHVPDAAMYDRVALVGPDAMSIHALEFGAGPGSGGHVSATRRQEAAAPGGAVVRLGDPGLSEPQVAEIYSFPTGRDPRRGTVRLSVAARVTDTNCGGTARVRTIHASGGDVPPRLSDLSVPMPDCRAVGRILVLKNLVEDLKIARN